MRVTSKVGGSVTFPYTDPTVCYIGIVPEDRLGAGHVYQIKSKFGPISEAIVEAKNGELDIYVVWPGKTRSDLFLVDDINALEDAWTGVV